MEKNIENCIEWVNGQERVTLSLSAKRYISKIKKLAEKFPTECNYEENIDKSIVAHVPLSWIKISPKRQGRTFTEEERAEISARFRNKRRPNES